MVVRGWPKGPEECVKVVARVCLASGRGLCVGWEVWDYLCGLDEMSRWRYLLKYHRMLLHFLLLCPGRCQ